ncbi:MAG: right-handed parallel beta-helix repeat-containing protein [Chitinophagales bacterium]|nr:right-handed parallel beta-helix repeat-containing protein [Chitinophagales bacterium]
MIRNVLPLILVLFSVAIQAQKFTTPNTGVKWTLSDLNAANAPVYPKGSGFIIGDDIEVSALDTILLNPNDFVELDSAVSITVFGSFFSLGAENNEVTITSVDSLKPYNGFRFEEGANAVFSNSIVKNGGGLRVIAENLFVFNCQFLNNVRGLGSSAVLDLSYGSPIIQNNKFINNQRPAISSPANRAVAAKIINNYFYGNNQQNDNRPQINMGTTGSDTLIISGNTIVGDRKLVRVGGIAVSNLTGNANGINTIIENNTIIDNRYGMTVAGSNAYALIKNNIIEDNDTEGQPNLGGSGISLNSGAPTQDITIIGNEIRRNLWGITIIGQASANLGDDDTPGNNIFADNGNEGVVYALYNNTPLTISAKSNCWIEGQESTLEQAGAVIFDVADDDTLGEVLYDPILCGVTVSTEDLEHNLIIFPNPAHDRIFISGQHDFNLLQVFSIEGRQLLQVDIDENTVAVPFDLKPGMYILQLANQSQKVNHKLIVE